MSTCVLGHVRRAVRWPIMPWTTLPIFASNTIGSTCSSRKLRNDSGRRPHRTVPRRPLPLRCQRNSSGNGGILTPVRCRRAEGTCATRPRPWLTKRKRSPHAHPKRRRRLLLGRPHMIFTGAWYQARLLLRLRLPPLSNGHENVPERSDQVSH
jgi:hypothetical protein